MSRRSRARRVATRLVGVPIVALLGACAASPDKLQSGERFAQDILAGRISLEAFDFERANYWNWPREERERWRAPLDLALYAKTLSSDTCDPVERRRFAAAMWLQLVTQAADASAWRADATALRAALARHDADVRAAGERVAPGANPRVTELARRVARDQLIRDFEAETRWAAELPASARPSWFPLKLARMMEIDCGDTEWLAAQMREIGWFDIPNYGADADKNAWLLVQHADRNREFQRETLAYLRALPPGSTNPRNLAYLEDRVATADGRPQRYGTQLKCGPAGDLVPLPIDDPAGVDARRAALGLPPMAEYAKRSESVCPKP